jgi:hypothetical protein
VQQQQQQQQQQPQDRKLRMLLLLLLPALVLTGHRQYSTGQGNAMQLPQAVQQQ